jgi:protein-tyrosine-phosphatase
VAAARRAGLDLRGATPRHLDELDVRPGLVVTVCDRAHEEEGVAEGGWVHWSVPDPVPVGTPAAFDATVVELRERISSLVAKAA